MLFRCSKAGSLYDRGRKGREGDSMREGGGRVAEGGAEKQRLCVRVVKERERERDRKRGRERGRE